MPDLKTAALYVRVSSVEQAEEGLSIPAQQRLLRQYAIDNGYSVDEDAIFIDAGESARTDKRPDFQRMIALAKQKPRPWDVILVHKMDRFARNRTDSVVYKSLLRHECGIDVISITESFGDDPVGRLMEGIMESIAEFYSANLALEVRKGKREGALKQLALGETPYGYCIGPDGTHEVDEAEAAVIRHIFETYTSNSIGLRDLGIYLRSDEALERFGTEVRYKRAKGLQGGNHKGVNMVWRPAGLRRILKNPAYAGEYVYKTDDGETIKGIMPSIVSRELFDMAQLTLLHRRRERGATNNWLLRGLVFCGYCGHGMSQLRQRWNLASGEERITHSVRCTEHVELGRCRPNLIRMREAEEMVIDYLEDASLNLNPAEVKITLPATDDRAKQLASLERKLSELPKQFDRQMAAYQAGVIDLDQLKVYRVQLDQQRETLETQVRELNDQINNTTINVAVMKSRLAEAVAIIKDEALPLQERKKALLTVVDRIEIQSEQRKCTVSLRYI